MESMKYDLYCISKSFLTLYFLCKNKMWNKSYDHYKLLNIIIRGKWELITRTFNYLSYSFRLPWKFCSRLSRLWRIFCRDDCLLYLVCHGTMSVKFTFLYIAITIFVAPKFVSSVSLVSNHFYWNKGLLISLQSY